MTFTATPLPGYLSDEAGIFELEPMIVVDGYPVRYAMVVALPATSDGYHAQTLIFAADADGHGDARFYTKHGSLGSYDGYADVVRGLQELGYTPALAEVPGD